MVNTLLSLAINRILYLLIGVGKKVIGIYFMLDCLEASGTDLESLGGSSLAVYFVVLLVVSRLELLRPATLEVYYNLVYKYIFVTIL